MATFPRAASDRVRAALADTPVVVVNGARQVGKSTLVRELDYPGSVTFLTLDDEDARAAARADPRAFVRRAADTVVIDEVQLVPALFRAVKAEIDLDRRPGRFVLTGSSRLLRAPDMASSLVGRVDIVELWPLAQDELAAVGSSSSGSSFRRSSFLSSALTRSDDLLVTAESSREQVIDRLIAGGFPEAVTRSSPRRAAWFDSYVRTTVQDVVQQLSGVERAAELPRLLRLCAARSGQELNISSLASDFGVPARTVDGYLSHLATAFLVLRLPAWSTNISSRVIRRPKLVGVDAGLTTHLVGADADTLARVDGSPGGLGPLLESFAAMEVVKLAAREDARIEISHFRERNGPEVDLVLEHPDGGVVGIEVKATSTPRDSDFRGLRVLEQRLGDRFRHGLLLSLADQSHRFGGRLTSAPVEVLWRGADRVATASDHP